LSKIFYAKAKVTDFHHTYLACFYRGIEQCLKRNNYMMSVVINNSLNLFQNEFKGARIVVPAFLAAIEQVLASPKPLDGIASKSQVLRNSCIKILGSILPLPHHYGSLKFRVDGATGDNRISAFNEVPTFRQNFPNHFLGSIEG
jgi:hypothetical protein